MEPLVERAWRTARKFGVLVLAVGALAAVAVALRDGIVAGLAVVVATPLGALAVMALVEGRLARRGGPAVVTEAMA